MSEAEKTSKTSTRPAYETARPYLMRLPKDRYRLAAASGADWTVHDYRLIDGRRRVLKLGSPAAQYRAFVPQNGPVMVYKFESSERHRPDPFDLERQLRAAEVLGTRHVPDRNPW